MSARQTDSSFFIICVQVVKSLPADVIGRQASGMHVSILRRAMHRCARGQCSRVVDAKRNMMRLPAVWPLSPRPRPHPHSLTLFAPSGLVCFPLLLHALFLPLPLPPPPCPQSHDVAPNVFAILESGRPYLNSPLHLLNSIIRVNTP